MKRITSIQYPNYNNPSHPLFGQPARVYHVFYSNKGVEHIHQGTQPRRFAAVERLIKAGSWSVTSSWGDTILTPAPVVVYVPTLAESFAEAAMRGFQHLDPTTASHFDTCAAEAESLVWSLAGRAESFVMGHIRRAILYRFYARSLIRGRADYNEILAAYEGMGL